MLLRCILLLLSISPLAETCVPTVPPEEYYPTASLPEDTTRPMEVTTAAEEMSTTAGGGGATEASTTAEEDLCNSCDIDAIAPKMLQPNVVYENLDEDPVNGCMRRYVVCRRDDSYTCDSTEMYAVNADTATSIFDPDLTTPSSVAAILTCGDDGKFFYESVMGIEQLTCNLVNCVP
ncbi:hypothetical protein CAEBREN_14406 [Caenorhabditis brenneri]|uniref:DUF281 domain-containing protein n=1 Tax=Caenorhabditis brenneri TaxID=135651 RepID=G0P321_CAEBE|nr:hypothetical protein CAEBREN_14406 [Caenorhabditis brenneri]